MKCNHCGTEFDGKNCPICAKKAQNQCNPGLLSDTVAVNTNSKASILAILMVVLMVLSLCCSLSSCSDKSSQSAPSAERSVSGEQAEGSIVGETASVSLAEQETKPTVNHLMRETGIAGNKDTSGEVKCSSEVFGNEKYGPSNRAS